MPHSAFNDPVLLSTGDLVVTGPVNPVVSTKVTLVPPVTLRFLLVQERDGQEPVIVEGVTAWTSGENWVAMIPSSHCSRIQPGKVRAIGIAILRWDPIPDPGGAPSDEPPTFETYTWCVTKNVTSGGGPHAS